MGSPFRRLGDIVDDDLHLVGRKTLGLAQLALAGFNVPDGTCVTTAAFAPIHESLAGVEDPSHALAKMATLPFVEELTEAVAAETRALLGDAPVAVRSSAVLEDLPAASFAGQYETFLNVSGREVAASVRKCWASIWSPRLVSYCAKNRIPQEKIRMAVLVQKMVPAEVSGVLFTLNPLSGVDTEMLLEASWGLGEGVVSGRVSPDRFVLDVSSRQVLSSEVGEKRTKFVPHPGGTREVEVDARDRRRPCLDAIQQGELLETGRRIQIHYGRPQDVEFAWSGGRLYVLQSRPITTYGFSPDFGEWTTADFRDGGVAASVCSPFMWSLYDFIWRRTLPDYLKGLKLLEGEIDRDQWGKVFFGRPYWNLGAVKRCLFNIPGFVERNFDTDLSIRVTYEGNGVTTPVTPWRVLKAVPTIIALNATYRRQLAFDLEFVERFERVEEGYDRLPIRELSLSALVPHFRRLIEETYFETESNYFLTIFNQSNSKIDFKQSLDKVLAAGHELSDLNLISGIPRLRTLMPLYDMWRLARKLEANTVMRDLLLSRATDEIVKMMSSSEAGDPAWSDIRDYIRRYRYHSRSELDLTVPRWDEDVSFVVETLRDFLKEGNETEDPELMNQRRHELYLAERRKAEDAFPRSPVRRWLSFSRRQFFSRLELVRKYTWWREEMRDRSARTYYLVRKYTMEIARRWVAEGVLEQEGDIFFLSFRQVFDVLDFRMTAPQARAAARGARDHNASFRNFENPNEIGSRWTIGSEQTTASSNGVLHGIGGSPGRALGPSKVIRSIAESRRLLKGDVLVTRFTDPGWTPVLNLVSAVITETGGLLSHAAIICREYGIPAVLNVSGATTILSDGQIVEVDGDRGTVAPSSPETFRPVRTGSAASFPEGVLR